MEANHDEPKMRLSIDEVAKALEEMLSSVMVTGAVDTEPESFRNIKEKMFAGEITPTEALTQARELVEARQNYH
jgi:hypothetical protein